MERIWRGKEKEDQSRKERREKREKREKRERRIKKDYNHTTSACSTTARLANSDQPCLFFAAFACF